MCEPTSTTEEGYEDVQGDLDVRLAQAMALTDGRRRIIYVDPDLLTDIIDSVSIHAGELVFM